MNSPIVVALSSAEILGVSSRDYRCVACELPREETLNVLSNLAMKLDNMGERDIETQRSLALMFGLQLPDDRVFTSLYAVLLAIDSVLEGGRASNGATSTGFCRQILELILACNDHLVEGMESKSEIGSSVQANLDILIEESIRQQELSASISPIAQIIRSIGLRKLLQQNCRHRALMERCFGNQVDDMILHLTSLTLTVINDESYMIRIDERGAGFKSFVDSNLVANTEEHLHYANLRGIRSRPLYRMEDGSYLILCLSFLSNMIASGMVYKAIAHDMACRNQDQLDRRLQEDLQYQVIRMLVGRLLPNVVEYERCLWPNQSSQSHPDLMFYNADVLLVIECKSSTLADHSKGTKSKESIVKDLAAKYGYSVGKDGTHKPKGVTQATEYVKNHSNTIPKLIASSISAVYPVLIVDDPSLTVDGLAKWLLDDVASHFTNVDDCVIIQLDTVIDLAISRSEESRDLHRLLKSYNARTVAVKENELRPSFETFVHSCDKRVDLDYLGSLFSAVESQKEGGDSSC